jgi:hypothetical protein
VARVRCAAQDDRVVILDRADLLWWEYRGVETALGENVSDRASDLGCRSVLGRRGHQKPASPNSSRVVGHVIPDTVLARIVRASASNIGLPRIMPPSLWTPRSSHCGEPTHPWLLTAFLISSRIFSGIGQQAQYFARSRCQWIRCSTGAFRGISFIACYSAFTDDAPCVDGDRLSVMARPDKDASSRCPRAPRCGSATHTGQRGRTAP